MNEKTREKILDWIFDNHQHHEDSDRTSMDLSTGTITTIKGLVKCAEGNSPYVNSMALEQFIKSL
jgi:hypothetical protein